MFTKEYEIKFYEVDSKNQLKESVLLNFLQDIASIHAEKLGFGYSFIKDKNLGWALLKYHLKVLNWPKDIEKIYIKTWPRGYHKLSCIRDFEIYSSEGEKLAAVSSCWVLIDMTTRRIVPASKVLNPFEYSDTKAIETTYPKIPDIVKVTEEKEFETRYDDFDINKHVNNANYLIWALEALPSDFRSNHLIREMEIQYKKEVTGEEKIVSLVEFDESKLTTVHDIKTDSGDSDLCKIRIHWTKE